MGIIVKMGDVRTALSGVSQISGYDVIDTLVIDRITLSEEEAKILIDVISTKDIHTLIITYIDTQLIGDDSVRPLLKAIAGNKTIYTLHLWEDYWTPASIKGIAEIIRDNRYIKELGLRTAFNTADMKTLFKALKVNRTLKELYMIDCGMGLEHMKSFSGVLKVNNTLNALYLTSNIIDSEGAKIIAKALATNKGLSLLDLSYNQIGEEGIKAMAEALTINKSLTTLHMQSQCFILPRNVIISFADNLLLNDSIAFVSLGDVKGQDYINKMIAYKGDAKGMKILCDEKTSEGHYLHRFRSEDGGGYLSNYILRFLRPRVPP